MTISQRLIRFWRKKSNSKHIYDLEERTFKFAKRVRIFIKRLPKTIVNTEDGKQLIRASGSVGSNYIVRLIKETNPKEFESETLALYIEAVELKKIFSSIIEKSK